jgi:endonuclease YncB( thermonuclease family)
MNILLAAFPWNGRYTMLLGLLGFDVTNALKALNLRSMRNLYGVPKNQGAIHDLFKIGAALVALILGSIQVASAGDFTGQASVIDGDTLEIHGARIRLWGIDAPESSQLCRGEDSLQYRCGAKAANDLDAFIAGRPVNCLPISLDRYGRTVATCSVGGTDLGDWLVRNGFALDWPQYSKRKYDDAQREAEHAGRGMWAGSYVKPWLYRVCIRASGIPSNCSDDANAHP